ncbi:MAG: N-acetylmuramoyl-L-alanine amidase family protein [Defluviitaleaceae bacterium]|nr:N-acetylmuramoyl-L-alanine amidase family protein [Defluviitaleaceae bacterium]
MHKASLLIGGLLSLFLVIFAPMATYAEDFHARLIIDGNELYNLSSPPIIVNDRTLVPVRDVFEHVGGVVGWHSVHRQVSLFYGEHVLVMTIDDTNAILNGNVFEMHTPPIVHNDRTMVPLRFPAEVFGFEVDWDEYERKAILNSTSNGSSTSTTLPNLSDIPITPLPPEIEDKMSPPLVDELPPPDMTASQGLGNNGKLARDVSASPIQTIAYPETTITTLMTPVETGAAAYVAVASSPISEVQYFLLPDNRLVVDIHNSLSMICGTFDSAWNVPVSGVRASQFSQTPRVTRIVFDVIGEAEYSISLSSDRKLLTVSFSRNRIMAVSSHSDSISDSLFIQGDVLPSINICSEGFPHFITLNIDNATMHSDGGFFPNGIFASHFSTGQRLDGTAYIRVYVHGDWPSFSISHNASSVTFMMHHGISGVRYDSVNRELRIPRNFEMDINNIQQINDYLRFSYTFVLPSAAETLGFGDISVMDGFVNSVSFSRINGNVHLTLNTARVLAFTLHEEAHYYIVRAHVPRDISPFIVVIDPGHGGSCSGAMHNGVIEKHISLAISQKVMQLLDADPSITAFTTRRDDTFVSLVNRTEFANNLGADLFISIHANAAEIRRGVINPYVHGIETWYTISELEQAANHRTDSRQLASTIQRHLIQNTGASDRGIKNEEFVVLRETNMPSVLLELGFLTNAAEAARLADSAHQWLLANAIYQGIVETFFMNHP